MRWNMCECVKGLKAVPVSGRGPDQPVHMKSDLKWYTILLQLEIQLQSICAIKCEEVLQGLKYTPMIKEACDQTA